MKMDVEILEENEFFAVVCPGDLFRLEYNDKIILENEIKERITIRYIGIFRLKDGGIGGYFGEHSQLEKGE